VVIFLIFDCILTPSFITQRLTVACNCGLLWLGLNTDLLGREVTVVLSYAE